MNSKQLKPKNSFNTQAVYQTINILLPILKKHQIKYRIFGSIAIAAINGKIHRRIGDIDLLVDEKKHKQLKKELIKIGYTKAGGYFTFSRNYLALEALAHPKLISIGYFWGRWLSGDSFIMKNNDRLTMSIEGRALISTQYSLGKIKFIGTPHQIIATGIHESPANPKRQKEIEILKQHKINPLNNDYIHIHFFGISADWTYHLLNIILNFIGNIRVKFGRPFDPWRI